MIKVNIRFMIKGDSIPEHLSKTVNGQIDDVLIVRKYPSFFPPERSPFLYPLLEVVDSHI